MPIAGLMAEIPGADLCDKLKILENQANSLGIAKNVNIFMELSFLALPVLPSVRITDKGLFKLDID